MKKNFCIILCGGAGSRLWPLSSREVPKQFLHYGKTLSPFQDTLKRAQSVSSEPPLIVCHTSHEHLVRSQATAIDILDLHVLLEPLPKNTTMSILCGLAWLNQQQKDVNITVMPADHVVHTNDDFAKDVQTACDRAPHVETVLFGIKPTYPATAYGYVKVTSADPKSTVYPVSTFEEKPTLEKAKDYVLSNQYYWNSGIFVFNQRQLTQAAQRHVPSVLKSAEEALAGALVTESGALSLPHHVFETVTSVSVDYGLMEKLDNISLVPASFRWHDIGSFKALWDHETKDEHGNVIVGQVGTIDTKSCYIHSDGPTVTTLGVEGLSVVATKDFVLVSDIHQTERVRDAKALPIVKTSQNKGLTKRPWGQFSTLGHEDKMFHVKKIVVKPGQILSLQKHKFRAEHWIILQGQASVTRDDTKLNLSTNDYIYIPKGAVHRIENVGAVDVIFIEVQTGSYFGEDDIIRLEDVYGRNVDKK